MSKKQITDLNVRLRLRWFEHYEQVAKKVSPTCRYFCISRGTFYLWYHRYLSLGVDGLKDKSSRPHKIKRWLPENVRSTIIELRLQRKYGPDRMSYYIRQKYNWDDLEALQGARPQSPEIQEKLATVSPTLRQGQSRGQAPNRR